MILLIDWPLKLEKQQGESDKMSLINNLWIKFFCKQVGVDQFGNTYFIGKGKNYLGQNKRFVLYNRIDDGSKVPAGWHAWLHYLSKDLPLETQVDYEWQTAHVQNLTGTKMAHDPSKSKHIKLESYSKWNPEKLEKIKS